jgi:hypothetical protein
MRNGVSKSGALFFWGYRVISAGIAGGFLFIRLGTKIIDGNQAAL